MAGGRSCKNLKRTCNPAEEMIQLKLVVDDENKRVLYAEAGVEFVDFLFSIVSLPLAFFAGQDECRLVIGRLYESLTKMEDSFFKASRWGKEALLKPALPSTFAGVKPGWPWKAKARRSALKGKRDGGGGGGMIYMITNELEVTPISTASILALMKSFEVSISRVNERMVTVGPEEKMSMLMALFSSKGVLTEIFLSPKVHNHAKPVLPPGLTISEPPVQRRRLGATSARTPASGRRSGAGSKGDERRTGRSTRGAKLRSSANRGRPAGGARSSANRGRRGGGSGRGRGRGRGRTRQVVVEEAEEGKILPSSSSSSASSDEDGGMHSDGETQAASHVKTERESSE